MLARSLLCALLLSGASLAASQSISNIADGFLQLSTGLARSQANANLYINKQIVRKSSTSTIGQSVLFITTKVYLTNSSANFGGLLDLNIASSMVVATASPLPSAISVQSNVALSATSLSLSTQAHAVVFPAFIEYNETNGVDGFQYGNDSVVKTVSMVTSITNQLLGKTFFPSISTSTETWPEFNSTANATVYVASACSSGGYCISFRLSNSTYVRNGATYLPDSVKVDLQASLSGFKTTSRLALLSTFLSTSQILPLANMNPLVNSAIQSAQQSGGLALCTPDFLGIYNSSGNVSATVTNGVLSNFDSALTAGYLNYARSASLLSTSGNSTVDVNAQVLSLTLTSSIQSAFDSTSYSTIYPLVFGVVSTTNLQYIVFSFLAPVNGASSLIWDPEIGTTAVTKANYVVTRSGSSGSGSGSSAGAGLSGAALSSGAVAGIVIGVLAVGGVVGFLGYRARSKKTTLLK